MIFEGQPLYTTGEKYFIDLVGPPIVFSIWWLYSRGWARTIQGTVSETTKRRQKRIFFIAVITAWILMFAGTTYHDFFAKQSSDSSSLNEDFVFGQLDSYEGACPTKVSFSAHDSGPNKVVEFYWQRSDGTKTHVVSATVPFDTEDTLAVSHSTSITDVLLWRYVGSMKEFRAMKPLTTPVVCTSQRK